MSYDGIAEPVYDGKGCVLLVLTETEINPDVEKPFEAIPKGSSDPRIIKTAEDMVRKNGPRWLMNNCKAHFQTTDKVLTACGSSRAELPAEGQVTSAVKNGDYKNA